MSQSPRFFTPPSQVRRVAPSEAAELVSSGKAVLVDVRHPDEWVDTGVAEPALLITLRDLGGPAGRELVDQHRDKEIIFYCLSGARSERAAEFFGQMGMRTANAGGIGEWVEAGLPLRAV